jgi:ADP-ribose pyrophosphatase YjhB (NUDIX family)
MPLNLLLDPESRDAVAIPGVERLRDKVMRSNGRILTTDGTGLDGAAAAIDRSGLGPDDVFYLIGDPSRLEAARRARVRACAIEPALSRRDRWAGVDELWSDMSGAVQWLERQLQLESRAWPIATVGGLVFRQDGKAFFVRTAKWSGTWGVPGGKIDYGEPSEVAFAREIREETGLEVAHIRFVLVQDAIEEPQFLKPRHFLLLNYTAMAATDSVLLNHESLEGGWFSLLEARDLDLNRPTRVLVEHVQGLPNPVS